jgi:hypothetical protein
MAYEHIQQRSRRPSQSFALLDADAKQAVEQFPTSGAFFYQLSTPTFVSYARSDHNQMARGALMPSQNQAVQLKPLQGRRGRCKRLRKEYRMKCSTLRVEAHNVHQHLQRCRRECCVGSFGKAPRKAWVKSMASAWRKADYHLPRVWQITKVEVEK